jgi:hypothetical protein
MKYRALKSFYGDLGSVRRNQILTLDDSRTLETLLKRKLLVAVGNEADDGLDKLTIGKLKELATKRELDLAGARTKPDILAALRAVPPAQE